MKNNSRILPIIIALAIAAIALVMVLVLRDVDGGNTNADITDSQAKIIALQDIDASEDEVTFTRCVLDTVDNRSVYDIEFYTDDSEYEYMIDSGSGSIYSKDRKTLSAKKEEAEEPSNEDVTVTEEEPDNGDAVTEKKTEKKSTTVKKKASKKKKSKTKEEDNSTDQGSVAKDDGDATTYIGTEKAKSIALSDAGVSGVRFEKAKLDHDDGRAVYEIEFEKGNKEYEYEIDALTGKILERDIDND